MIKSTTAPEAGIPPSPAPMAGMAQWSQEMTEAGVLLASGGLQPSAMRTPAGNPLSRTLCMRLRIRCYDTRNFPQYQTFYAILVDEVHSNERVHGNVGEVAPGIKLLRLATF